MVFAGLVYVFTLTGQFFSITWEVLTLLGIAGTGSVAARMVALSQGRLAKPDGELKFSDLFRSDGVLDLFKLQMFLFTVATAAYVLLRVVLDQAFPVLDTNLLLLLGISNGIYVGSKVAGGESPFQLAERHDLELRLLEEALDQREGRTGRARHPHRDGQHRHHENEDKFG